MSPSGHFFFRGNMPFTSAADVLLSKSSTRNLCLENIYFVFLVSHQTVVLFSLKWLWIIMISRSSRLDMLFLGGVCLPVLVNALLSMRRL